MYAYALSTTISRSWKYVAIGTMILSFAFNALTLDTFCLTTTQIPLCLIVYHQRNMFAKLLFFLLSAQVAHGFAPLHQSNNKVTSLQASEKPISERFSQFCATAGVVLATSPLVALAEEADDIEYGSVDAPIGIAVAGGILAILTAAVPVLMQGGEEEFNKMRDQDSATWGTGQTDAVKRKRR